MGKHKTPAEREIALRVGARIRQLREIQHISQINLATEIGIRAGPLGWIEKGKHLPSGRVLYRIAKQLNVRIDDLFQESDVWQTTSSVPSASMATVLPPLDMEAPAESVKAAHIVCQSLTDRLVDLEKLCGGARSSDLPLYIPFAPTEAGSEGLAVGVRQALGIGGAAVSDYVELLEGAGLRVVFLDLPDGCLSFSGYDAANRNAFIFLNVRNKKQPELQVFRLAFELGRVYLCTRKLYGNVSADGLVADEVVLDECAFARRFAAAFLMPAGTLQAAAGQLGLTPKTWTWDLVLRLKKRYGVSAQNFALRLQALKLTWSDKQKKTPRYYLFKEESDAALAEGEPGGNRAPLSINGRLGDLLLRAEQTVGKDPKPLNALKRALRQAGVRLDA